MGGVYGIVWDCLGRRGGDGDLSEAELCTIDFAGWNYFTVERPSGVTAIDYLKYSSNSGGYETKDIYIDALSQEHVLGIPILDIDIEEIAYPNPLTGDVLWIKDPEQKNMEYWLYMPTGQLIQHGTISGEKQSIRINDAVKEQSMFILRIKLDNAYFSQTIITDLK